MPAPASSPRPAITRVARALLATGVAIAAVGPPALSLVTAAPPPDHLVVSEVVTGGSSASDEIVEIHNPTSGALPLEGLELVYVSATGGTITRRVSWPAGAPTVPPGGHVLVANDAGGFAPIADALYSGGMASTGGSVALRIQGAASAVDAVGWGTATSIWREGAVAPAPGAGESLERLPGGAAGSTQDTGDNATDFVVRAVPDPQNLGSPPTPDPAATPLATSTPQPTGVPTMAPPTAEPTVPVTPTVAPTPGATSVPIATARALPDGTTVTIDGVAVAGSDFTDGGGYVLDDSGGIAVLSGGEAFARGRALRVTGEVDDRFGQRTLRVAAGGIVDTGPGSEPSPSVSATGAVGEAIEGRLVRISATITSAPTVLSAGTAFDVDDGSGTTRLVVATATGIDVSEWRSGTTVDVVGIVGQRDSTGSGSEGYRVQPRDVADLLGVGTAPSATPTAVAGEPTPAASPSAPSDSGIGTIAAARDAGRNARVRVRGTVTLGSGTIDPQTAAIQDASGAIVLRLSDEAGPLRVGQRVEVTGTRSTKSGMETIRVTTPPQILGSGTEPDAASLPTGGAGEAHEARLVSVRGGLVAAARRASSGTVSMEIDDGSGPLRVVVGRSIELDRTRFTEGTWIEVRGVLGQETTGSEPTRGYRVWARTAADLRVTAEAVAAGTGSSSGNRAEPHGGDGAGVGDLGALAGSTEVGTVGATLVVGPWPELGLAGLLWDGQRLVGVAAADGAMVSVLTGDRRPPIPVELDGLRAVGPTPGLDLPLVRLATGGSLRAADGRPVAPPVTAPARSDGSAQWLAMVGRIEGRGSELRLRTAGREVPLDRRCERDEALPRGIATATGISLPGRPAIIVPCGGLAAGSTLLARAVTGEAGGPDGPAAGPVVPAADTSVAPGTAAAGALLAVGAVTLGGVAAWARWRRGPSDATADAAALGDDTEDPQETGDAGADDPPVGGTAAGTPGAPVLTLLPLRRERGP